MSKVDFTSAVIAKDKVVSNNTVYSDELDIRTMIGIFLTSLITTTASGETHIEITDADKSFWSLLDGSSKTISTTTQYAVDLQRSSGAYLRQVVTLSGAGTFTTNINEKR